MQPRNVSWGGIVASRLAVPARRAAVFDHHETFGKLLLLCFVPRGSTEKWLHRRVRQEPYSRVPSTSRRSCECRLLLPGAKGRASAVSQEKQQSAS